jgi:hypothetical protein
MQVVMYHEVRPDNLDEVLRSGIKRTGDGEKTDGDIHRTDELLDSRIPAELAERGVTRRSVVYGYLSSGDDLVDIRDGRVVDPAQFSAHREQILLRIVADTAVCFVSDLDAYDAVKMCVESDADDAMLGRLADRYWARVVPFTQYEAGSYRRPEVMAAEDIAPENIEVLRSGGGERRS